MPASWMLWSNHHLCSPRADSLRTVHTTAVCSPFRAFHHLHEGSCGRWSSRLAGTRTVSRTGQRAKGDPGGDTDRTGYTGTDPWRGRTLRGDHRIPWNTPSWPVLRGGSPDGVNPGCNVAQSQSLLTGRGRSRATARCSRPALAECKPRPGTPPRPLAHRAHHMDDPGFPGTRRARRERDSRCGAPRPLLGWRRENWGSDGAELASRHLAKLKILGHQEGHLGSFPIPWSSTPLHSLVPIDSPSLEQFGNRWNLGLPHVGPHPAHLGG